MNTNAWSLLSVCLVILLPLIPTLIIYKVIQDRRARAAATGTILGLKFETSGAIASYVVLLILALFILKQVTPDPIRKVHVTVELGGDPEKVNKLIENAESSSQLTLTNSTDPPISIAHVDVSRTRKTLNAEFAIQTDYIGKSYNATLSYSGQDLSLSPSPAKIQDPLLLKAVVGSPTAIRQWTAVLDAYSLNFKGLAKDIYSKEFILLKHDSEQPIDSIILHSYLGPGQLVYFEVGARAIDGKRLESFREEWARSAFEGKSADDYSKWFDDRFNQYKQMGDELAVRHFTNDNFSLPGQGARFQRGLITLDDERMIPTIGPVPGGIGSDRLVMVFVDMWRKSNPEFQRLGREITTGDTFERATDRVVFGLRSEAAYPIDMPTVRTQYKSNALTPVEKIGDAQLQRGVDALILDLRDVSPSNVIQLFWSWKNTTLTNN